MSKDKKIDISDARDDMTCGGVAPEYDAPVDVLGLIMDYEGDGLSGPDTLKLFSTLIRTGQAWQLQGHYGRTAKALIEGGHLSPSGEILVDPEEVDG